MLLALCAAGVGTADANNRGSALNTTAQVVTVARWTVVLKDGTTPATGPATAMTYTATPATPQYAVLTNTGTVTPGSVLIKSSGLTVLPTVQGCLVPWTGINTCSTGAFPVAMDPTPVTPAPAGGQTYYLRISTTLALTAMVFAVSTAPAATTTST